MPLHLTEVYLAALDFTSVAVPQLPWWAFVLARALLLCFGDPT
jgi:hypothetical protein